MATFTRSGAVVLALAVVASACHHGPPQNFAPDPGLVSHIKALHISAEPTACPGQLIRADYAAELDDGRVVTFANQYDEDHPPPLHVMFLSMNSLEAEPRSDGNWRTVRDPLVSALKGFNLSVALKAKPELKADQQVQPEYSCLPHAFEMEGGYGRTARSGGDGPDVVVRIGIVTSPYVSRLLVASVAVERESPVYVLADATQVPPADWLRVVARGGHGGNGESGARGVKGRDGASGCPGSPGGAGGAGGNGGPAGPGGRGGRVTIYVSESDPFLAGLVDAHTPGGHGGDGGLAGKGGDGGKGGAPSTPNDRRCAKGADGSDGPNGAPGEDGRNGPPGLRPEIITLPDSVVFGQPLRAELAEMIRMHRAPGKGN